MNRYSRGIREILGHGVSPAGVLFVFNSMFLGLFFTFFPHSKGVEASVLYQSGVAAGLNLFGIAMLFGSLLTIFGLIKKNRTMIQIGAFVNFSSWLYAAGIYATGGYWWQFCGASVTVLIYAYFYLAGTFARKFPFDPLDKP